MTRAEKDKIRKHVKAIYESAENIRIQQDGSVTAQVDPMPNTNQAGRIFCGWDTELLKEANRGNQ